MKSLITIVVISFLITIFQLKSVAALEYRLSKDVFPLNYDIKITPYFLPDDGDKRFTFYGETSIIIYTTNMSIREFAVHADYLEFIDVSLWSVTGDEVEFTNDYEEETDKLIFRMKEDILRPFVNHTIKFRYTGRISYGYDGLYRISYNDPDANEKWMVATQLQRIDARKLFPCFDEPSFKAYFNIHISRPKTYSSFSNTVLLTTTVDDNETDRYVDHFDTTPYMSTYLVAMVVCEFKPRGEDNLYIIARPEYYNKTEFSYNVTREILSGYNKLFGISYPALGNAVLQKISLSKFTHNGMENWGLMIYKDEVLIFEDGNTDLNGMQYTITIISHETSHNWFGNSITFDWWGHFWLNEGFARYYQYFATHKIYPQYELDKQFIVDQLQYIFNIDAVNSTQPLSEPNVASPSEIARKFSGITYVKGASVIRMINHAMTEPHFQNAMREYISKNLNSSVIPSDLLKYLKLYWPPSPKVDVDVFFYDWTEQVGLPLLNVTLANDNLSVKVTQSRYLNNTEDGSDPNLRYTIPITYTTSAERNFNNTYPITYFNKNQSEINLTFTEPIQWIMFNIQQTSYYRVMYDNNLWYKLHYALFKDNWSGIHEINRAQFIDDLFAFAKATLFEYDLVFKWLEYLETEIYYTPWEAAFNGFKFIGPYLTVEEHIDFGSYILYVTEKVFTHLGVTEKTGESVLDNYNRKQIVNFNCKYGRKDCTTEVQRILREYLNNEAVISVDIRSTVYCSGMREATEEDFDKLHHRFKAENVLREKLRLRYGLGCGRNKRNMEKFFEIILSSEVPVDEKEGAMSPLYNENPENVWPAYQMITSRVEEVAKALDSWSTTANLISSIATLLTREEERNAFEEFITENRAKFDTSAGILDNALCELDNHLEWAKKHLAPLRTYLKARNTATTIIFVNLIVITIVALTSVLL